MDHLFCSETKIWCVISLQPPWDDTLQSKTNGKDAFLLHYTYGNDFDLEGNFTPGKVGPWHFDKRDFTARTPFVLASR